MTEVSEIVRTDKTVPPGWMQMASGKGVDLARPRPEDVDFNDIAVHLSRITRFTGAAKITVAQHSVLVACLLPVELQAHGLLHDAHEAYFGDDGTPKKNLIALVSPTAAAAIADLKRRWDLAIWEAARLKPPTEEEHRQVKVADYMALSIERRDCMARPADAMTKRAWAWLPEPRGDVTVRAAKPKDAEAMFLRACGALVWGNAGGVA